jgi:DNA-binding protein HU-beta
MSEIRPAVQKMADFSTIFDRAGLCVGQRISYGLAPDAHGAHKGARNSMADTKPSKPITTKQLAYNLAEQHQLTKKQGMQMLEDLVGLITKHLKKGERVKIAGLGVLQVRKRAARMGRNPATGEPIHIKASKKVAFRATKELKMAI